MTQLIKPVKRVSDAMVRDAGKLKRLVVTLYPNQTIGVRPERTRREEIVTIAAVYSLAVKQRVALQQSAKRAAKAAKRRIG